MSLLALAVAATSAVAQTGDGRPPAANEAPSAAVQAAPLPLDTPLATLDGTPITRRDLLRRLVQRYRATKEGETALSELIDNRLVEREMKARSITVDAAAIDAKFKSLDKMMADSGAGKTLAEELAGRGVAESEFRDRLGLLLGLEALARQDFSMKPGEEVPNAKQHLWLKTAREKAKIEFSAETDGPNVALVGGEPITVERFGEELEKALPSERLRECLNEAVGIRLVAKLSAEAGVTIGDDDVRADIAARKKQFEADPRFQGVPYDEYVKATRGAGAESFLSDPDFRAQVALKKIVVAKEGREAVRKRFDERQDVYGARVHVKQVFIQASEKPLPPPLGDGKTTRTFADAEKLAREAKKELDGGAKWKDVVSKYSEDASRLREGDLGFFPEKNRFGPEFYASAKALAPNAISEPIRSSFGWHVIQLVEARPAPAFDEAFERVLADLAGERYREAFNAAKVEFLPAAPIATKSAKPNAEGADDAGEGGTPAPADGNEPGAPPRGRS